MRIPQFPVRNPSVVEAAYAMIDVVIGFALLATMFASLYGGITSGFAVTQVARENLRGTQIMLERMEGVRLYNWNQVVYSNMIPATFTNYYYPLASNGTSKGIKYFGTMSVTDAGLNPTATYSTNMRLITVSILWTNGSIPRSRTMSTYVSQNGIQNYVYSN